MQLSYNIEKHGNLFPAVYNYLRSLPDTVLQHSDHSLPHPLAIYNKSMHRVLQSFQGVLDENDKLYSAPFVTTQVTKRRAMADRQRPQPERSASHAPACAW